MKLRKLLLTLASLSALFLLNACVANTDTAHKKSTAFGLYTYEPGAFTRAGEATASIRTDEATGMELPSGDKTQFFWGLITIQDY